MDASDNFRDVSEIENTWTPAEAFETGVRLMREGREQNCHKFFMLATRDAAVLEKMITLGEELVASEKNCQLLENIGYGLHYGTDQHKVPLGYIFIAEALYQYGQDKTGLFEDTPANRVGSLESACWFMGKAQIKSISLLSDQEAAIDDLQKSYLRAIERHNFFRDQLPADKKSAVVISVPRDLNEVVAEALKLSESRQASHPSSEITL